MVLLPCAAQAADQSGGQIESAYVELGPSGTVLARAITRDTTCPAVLVDGASLPMRVRAGPATEPQRPTRSTPELSKPSAFPVLTCEAALPPDAHSAEIGGRALPLPAREVRRIVVIGDTGCRLKASDGAYQACNDPAAYPFAAIAARAAAWRPDLVIHVGDYLYRENACPEGNQGCAGSPWGYGWDAWNADFFNPAAALLAAAPWAMARGNHESCIRAGQGWWRFLETAPLTAERSCNDAAQDVLGDEGASYAVPLGEGAQVIMMDVASAGIDPLAADDPHAAQLLRLQQLLGKLAGGSEFTFAAGHYPFLGIGARLTQHGPEIFAENQAILSTFGKSDPSLTLPGIDVVLSGHIHLWEQADYGPDHPSQIIAGMSGTLEDEVPIDETAAIGTQAASGAIVQHFAAVSHGFGFMTLERFDTQHWLVELHSVDGAIMRRCVIDGRQTRCAVPPEPAD